MRFKQQLRKLVELLEKKARLEREIAMNATTLDAARQERVDSLKMVLSAKATQLRRLSVNT